jgi:hypothetical protein
MAVREYVDSDGFKVREIRATATYTDSTGLGTSMELQAEGAWSVTRIDRVQGIRYEMILDLKQADRFGDFSLSFNSSKTNYASGDVGGSNLFLSPDPVAVSLISTDRSVWKHEVGHLLGFSHASNKQGDVMSYDNVNRVKLRHLQQLYEKHK